MKIKILFKHSLRKIVKQFQFLYFSFLLLEQLRTFSVKSFKAIEPTRHLKATSRCIVIVSDWEVSIEKLAGFQKNL